MRSIEVAIVDDSKVIRERLVQRLSRLVGVQIIWQAANVQDAIDAFRLHQPDAMILDLRMPDGSGCEVIDAVKKECPNITVIVLTNYALRPLKKRCLVAGADYFFDKTSEFKKVFAVLKSMTLDTKD